MRKAGVDIEDGDEVELVGQGEDAPEEAAVGRIEGERAVLVLADQRSGEVSEELVVVVEVATGARPDVAAGDRGTLAELPANHGEEFLIALCASVEQLQLRSRQLHGVDEKVAMALAAFVADAQQQVADDFTVELQRPT